MNTFENLKKLIKLEKKSKKEILNMMDIFFMNNRITETQYNELTFLLNEISMDTDVLNESNLKK